MPATTTEKYYFFFCFHYFRLLTTTKICARGCFKAIDSMIVLSATFRRRFVWFVLKVDEIVGNRHFRWMRSSRFSNPSHLCGINERWSLIIIVRICYNHNIVGVDRPANSNNRWAHAFIDRTLNSRIIQAISQSQLDITVNRRYKFAIDKAKWVWRG